MRGFMKRIAPVLALLRLLVASGNEAGADLIYNSGAPSFAGGAAISGGEISAGFFSLGADTTLTEVKFVSLDQPVVSPTLGWFVYDDTGGTPGQVVASGTATSTKAFLQLGFGPFDYDRNDFAVPGLTLAAGSYFLGLNDAADSSKVNGQFPRNWALNTPVSPNLVAQRTGTGPWQAFPSSGVSFQLFGSPATLTTPEPSTLVYSGTAVAMALGGYWLRRRASFCTAGILILRPNPDRHRASRPVTKPIDGNVPSVLAWGRPAVADVDIDGDHR